MVYNANGLYSHKAQISNEFNSLSVSNKVILACHGYSFEEFPDAFDMHPFTDRANFLGTAITFKITQCSKETPAAKKSQKPLSQFCSKTFVHSDSWISFFGKDSKSSILKV